MLEGATSKRVSKEQGCQGRDVGMTVDMNNVTSPQIIQIGCCRSNIPAIKEKRDQLAMQADHICGVNSNKDHSMWAVNEN